VPRRSKLPGPRRPASIKDVAHKAGVSIAAASYALNGRGGIAEGTRLKILKAAQALDYVPSKPAQSMRTGRTDSIGLVLPDISNPFFPEFAKAVQQSAATAGKSVFLVDCNNDPAFERDGVKSLVRQGIDGLIWWPSDSANQTDLVPMAQAVVLVDSVMEGIDTVTSDHAGGGRLLAELITRVGIRTVGLIRGPGNFRSAELRRRGYLEHADPRCHVAWDVENSFSAPLNDLVKRTILDHPVEAIICNNDLIAIELISYLKSIGRRVPEDVAVTGFGDIRFADIITPALTTVHQPLADLGREAVRILHQRMATPAAPPVNLVLPVTLAVRQSTPAKARNAV